MRLTGPFQSEPTFCSLNELGLARTGLAMTKALFRNISCVRKIMNFGSD